MSRAAVQDLLHKVKFVDYERCQDIELRRRVAEITDTWDFGESMHPHINTALVLAESAYDHLTDLNAKVIITIVTALLISTDDSNALDGLGFDQFHRRHLDCTLHADKSRMGLLANVLSQMVECFPNFGAGTILVSVLQIVNGRKLESIARETTLHQKALPFVEYRRMVTGGPEAYAFMIWEKARFPTVDSYIQAIPDACKVVNHFNDILSFYKEELANELSNYIHDHVIVTGIAPSDTLRNVIDESVSASERVRAILGEGDARDAWDAFVRGYIKFHIDDPRYRLRQLFGDNLRNVVDE